MMLIYYHIDEAFANYSDNSAITIKQIVKVSESDGADEVKNAADKTNTVIRTAVILEITPMILSDSGNKQKSIFPPSKYSTGSRLKMPINTFTAPAVR